MNNEYEHRKKTAVDLVHSAGHMMLDFYHTHFSVHQKEAHDYVSALDEKIERMIRAEINSLFSDDQIIGEEMKLDEGGSSYGWIVDPIDGTNNYVRNIPLAGVQIALTHNSRVLFGVIYQPFLRELYIAEKNKGAKFLNQTTGKSLSLKVAARPLGSSLVIFDAGLANRVEPSTRIFSNLMGQVDAVRVFGVAVSDFPFIAKGGADALISSIAKPYDIAAGALLVEEAGGKVTDLRGQPWDISTKHILVSTPANHTELVQALQGVLND